MAADLADTSAPWRRDLGEALICAPDLDTAVDITLDQLVALHLPMVILYLARGDRLRCLGHRGWSHIHDGLMLNAGLVGSTFTSGVSIRTTPDAAPPYIAASPGIAEEVCVPIRVAGKVVGVLNVESMQPLPAEALENVEECARLFGERLAALGGPPGESTADQRIRHAARMTAITRTDELWTYVAKVARGVAGTSAAAVIDLSAPEPRVVVGIGALGERLREIPGADWSTIAERSCHGTSSHASGIGQSPPLAGFQTLHAAGAQTLILVPVFAEGQCRALLVCADGQPGIPAPVVIARLELLAAHLGSCLQTLDALDELRGRAMQDPLTGLGNRSWFLEKVQKRLDRWSSQASRAGQFAVMFCDLDGFKDVNDSLGHAAGDCLLVTVAERMRERLHPGELLARLGGDEFGLCSDRFSSVSDAYSRAAALSDLLAPHFDLDGVEVGISASIGISVASGNDACASDAERLLREADAAMYEAKRSGRSGVALFTDDLRSAATQRLAIATGLRKAVSEDQLRLVYQPIVALPSGEVVGVEALLRWHHPERGLLVPSDFIAVAEDTRQILELGAWALQESCAQLARWDEFRLGALPLTIGVNLSPRHVTDPALPGIVRAAVADSGIDPGRLVLEITESALMHDVAAVHAALAALKSIGVVIAIDDFGTGFSSLAYLKRFPVDILKIDASFIDGLPDDAESRAIVAAIVAMASALGLDLVAEGVQTQAQRDCLTVLRCQNAQGHLFAPAQSAAEMTTLLARRGRQ